MTSTSVTPSASALPAHLRIAFIGGGNMARSLIGGLISAGHPTANIAVSEPDAGQRERLQELGAIAIGGDNSTAAVDADIVVLAVKPQVLGPVCTGLRPALGRPGQLVVSIAAGVPM